jgi:amino acid transporter
VSEADESGAAREVPAVEDARPLGLGSLLALGVNGIVGVGIFFAPKELAALAPGWGIVAVLAVTGASLLPVALAVSKVGSRFEEDGGPVLYARAAFGDTAGFIVGWLAYVSALFSAGTVMAGLTGAVLPELGPIGLRLAATALVTVLSLVCATGVKISARVWTTLTILKLLPLLGLAALALVRPAPGPAPPPFDASGVDWFRAALKATFVFQGFEIVPVIAGQAHASRRNVPIAVVASLLSATAIYLVLVRGAVLGVPDLAHSGAPLVDTARAYGGDRLAHLVAAGTSVSGLGIAFGMVATTPRYLSALAPGTRFASERKGVPLMALVTTWAFVVVLVFAGSLGELLTLSSLAVVMQYLIVALALGKFAWRRERGLSPGAAWSAVPTAIVALLLLSGATGTEWAVAGACAVVGGVLRTFYVRVKRAV